jgi:hypothetical protein
MIEGGLGPVALSFQSGGALSQDIVQLDDAVFNRAIKPPHAIFAVGQFLLQSRQPIVGGLALCRLALNRRFQEVGDAVGGGIAPGELCFAAGSSG